MLSRLRRVVISTAVIALFTVTALVIVGCGGISPFLSAQFASTMVGTDEGVLAQGGANLPEPEDETIASAAITSVADLPEIFRGLSVTVANESQTYVRFSMVFAVSAGPGGFVEDDLIQDYITAGYDDALIPGSGNIATIGCDTLTLVSGTRLLTMEFGIGQGDLATLAPGIVGDQETPQLYQLRRRNNASDIIPLPEIIIFGEDDSDFTCTGGDILGDLCTQRGFVYSSAADIPVGKAIEASRIQGTVCNEGFGTAPEWRLDKTTLDGQVQPYQYGAGGTIIVTILDRWNDSVEESRNQAVWLVTDGDGNTIHFPQP